jgi:CheY-like chemotaxis protein
MNEIEKQKRILIAEDDPVSRRMLESLLLKWAYDVTVVANGIEAFRLLDSADAPSSRRRCRDRPPNYCRCADALSGSPALERGGCHG